MILDVAYQQMLVEEQLGIRGLLKNTHPLNVRQRRYLPRVAKSSSHTILAPCIQAVQNRLVALNVAPENQFRFPRQISHHRGIARRSGRLCTHGAGH